jgi:hypothetical protein
VSATSWNESAEVKELQDIDIGLYPLPDDDWVLEAGRTVVEGFSVRANQEAYLKVLDSVFRREKGPDREGEA